LPAKAAKKKNPSALKRVRQAKKHNVRNSAVRSKIRTLSKKIEAAAAGKNKEALEQLLRETTRVVKSAVTKDVLHKNTAARKISRLSKLANTVLAPATR